MNVTQGRMIPETDAERVASQLDLFSRQIATVVLHSLTDAIRMRRSGSMRFFVHLKRGMIVGANVSPDVTCDITIDLDDDGG